MQTNFRIQDGQNGKLVQLSSPLNNRVRILDLCYALKFLGGTILSCYQLPDAVSYTIVGTIITLLGLVTSAIAFYRFINKATESERLFANEERIDILVSGLFKMQKRSFLISGISEFKFLEKERYEPHPLKGESFDYLGFQTEQAVIQDLHSEGRVSFFVTTYGAISSLLG